MVLEAPEDFQENIQAMEGLTNFQFDLSSDQAFTWEAITTNR